MEFPIRSFAYLHYIPTMMKTGYTNFVQIYVTVIKRRSRPHKVYLFLFNIIN